MLKKITAGLVLIISIFSCHHHSSEDVNAPEINILSPVEASQFNNGDTLFIKANISDDTDLHEALIQIKRSSDQFIIFSHVPEVHGYVTYDIDTFWIVQTSITQNARVEIISSDHFNNIDTGTVEVIIGN